MRTIFFITILVYFGFFRVHAINPDSIKSLILSVTENEQPILYNQLSLYYLDSTGNQSKEYAIKSIELSKKHGLDNNLAYAYVMLGSSYLVKSEFKEALETFNIAIHYSEVIENYHNLHTIYNNIGVIYRNLNEQDLAIKNFAKAVEYALLISDNESLIQTYTNIGNTYAANEDFTKSLEYFNLALKICDKHSKSDSKIASLYHNMGYVHFMNKNYSEAIVLYEKALYIFDSLKITWGITASMNNIAHVLIKQEKYKEADILIQKTDSIHKSADLRESRKILYKTAYELYSSSLQWEQAFNYLQKYHELNDSIYSYELTELISEIKSKHEIETLKRDSELKEIKLKDQNNTISFFVILSSLLILTGFFIASLYTKKLKLSKSLSIRNKIIEEKNDFIKENLLYANEIRKTCMNNPTMLKRSEYFVLDIPLSTVGGDFFMARKINDSDYYMVGDSTGHGVSGAFLSVLAIQFIDSALHKYTEPDQICNFLNTSFYDYFSRSNKLAGESLCFSIIKIENNLLHFAGSKQRMYVANNEVFREYKFQPEIIGLNKNNTFHKQTIKVSNHVLIYLSTDGFPDQFGGVLNKKLKYQQFRDLLLNISGKEFISQPEILKDYLTNWKGNNEQTDDILIAGIRIK